MYKVFLKEKLKYISLFLRLVNRRLLLFFSYSMARLSGRLIKNLYGLPTGNNKYNRVLLIYITNPFLSKNNFNHTNTLECQELAKVISSLGYMVDIIDFSWRLPISYYQYHLIIGFGDLYEKSFYDPTCSALRILYATGAPMAENCIAETRRIHLLSQRRGKLLRPRRVIDRVWPCSLIFSDAIISVTEGWASNKYQKYNKEVYCIPVTSACDPENSKLDILHGKRNDFVWFGSWGAVHKGLDLCLETFAGIEDITLHVCGDVQSESDFWDEYEDLLTNRKNIHYHGFVNVRSAKMEEIMRVSQFVILPSSSEGCATSVLTCMAWGCIPVVTKETGITFDGSILIEEETVETIKKVVYQCFLLDRTYLQSLSERAQKWIKEKHNLVCYSLGVQKVLREILNKHPEKISHRT